MPTLRSVLEEFRTNSGLPVSLNVAEPAGEIHTPSEFWSKALGDKLKFDPPIYRRVERNRLGEERFTGKPAFKSATLDEDMTSISIYEVRRYAEGVRTGEEIRRALKDPDAPVTPQAYFKLRGIFKNERDVQKAFYDNKIRYDVTIIPPARWGSEPAKTHGHYHDLVDAPEICQVISGEAWYLMQKLNEAGDVANAILVKAKAGDFVIMLPYYGHVIINPSKTRPLIMANWLRWHQNPKYGSYKDKRGAAYYVVETPDGSLAAEPNSNYKDLPPLREMAPSIAMPQFGLWRNKPIYNLLDTPEYLSFLTNPKNHAFLLTPEATLSPVSTAAHAPQPVAPTPLQPPALLGAV
jgi:glucose-6-phosphate isomerase